NETAEPLPNVSPLDKIIVAFAGPLFSFLLAVGFALVVWGVGKPTNEGDTSTRVGWVDENGPAWKAGLRPGDRILEVDGHPVKHFAPTSADSVTWRIVTSEGTNIPIRYVRDGQEATANASVYHRPRKEWKIDVFGLFSFNIPVERTPLRQVLIMPAMRSVIYSVASNSPAALAGLVKGDEVVAVDGKPIYHPWAVISVEDSWSNSPVTPITLTVKRGDQQFDRTLLAVKPVQPTNSSPSLGILELGDQPNVTLVYPGPLEQIRSSVDQIFGTIGALLHRKGEIGVQQLGGAVMIARVYYNLFESEEGWRLALWFSVIFNVNLALINLLPLPVLDGGHILLSLIEAICRRPISARILNAIQTGFAMLLIGFMVYIAYFDTGDWFRSARDNREPVIVFAPAR
ncbi:MAG TPA: site-2 protease family protein, partial [Candidatus Acidoferrum sp.]|nr:site-2 protease family protein [Candidatus Acidoferrum sp.]